MTQGKNIHVIKKEKEKENASNHDSHIVFIFSQPSGFNIWSEGIADVALVPSPVEAIFLSISFFLYLYVHIYNSSLFND